MRVKLANEQGNPYRAPGNKFLLAGDAVVDIDDYDGEVQTDAIAKLNSGFLARTTEEPHLNTKGPLRPQGAFTPDPIPWRKERTQTEQAGQGSEPTQPTGNTPPATTTAKGNKGKQAAEDGGEEKGE